MLQNPMRKEESDLGEGMGSPNGRWEGKRGETGGQIG